MSAALRVPAPVEDADTQPYWAAAREGGLVLQRCVHGHWQFPPRVRCHVCLAEVAWEPVEGTAVVYSVTVVHRAPAGFTDSAPYAVALVELAEGVRMVTNILDCPAESVHIGMALRACFERRPDGTVLPQFEPLEPVVEPTG